MKVIVFGANGQTGQAFIKQALEKGLSVTAFVRDKGKLNINHPNLTVMVGEATKEEEVVQGIKGHDAVVNCLGGPGMKPSTILTEMTANICKGMETWGIQRIVQVSSAGVHQELKGISGKIISFLLRNPLKDHRGAFNVLFQSGVQYTLARPMQLTNEEGTGMYREAITGVPDKGMKISRSDVAHFLLKALLDNEYIGKSIGLAK